MEEIMSKAECYIQGEESNAKKKAKDAKERGSTGADIRNYYLPPTRDRGTFNRQERRTYNLDSFTLLNTRLERIYKEVYQSRFIPNPLKLEAITWVMTQRYGVNTIEFEAIQLTTAGSLRKRLRNLYMKGNSEVKSEEGEEKTSVVYKRKRAKRTARKIQRKDQPSIPSLEAL
jgi:hypothetical protein